MFPYIAVSYFPFTSQFSVSFNPKRNDGYQWVEFWVTKWVFLFGLSHRPHKFFHFSDFKGSVEPE